MDILISVRNTLRFCCNQSAAPPRKRTHYSHNMPRQSPKTQCPPQQPSKRSWKHAACLSGRALLQGLALGGGDLGHPGLHGAFLLQQVSQGGGVAGARQTLQVLAPRIQLHDTSPLLTLLSATTDRSLIGGKVHYVTNLAVGRLNNLAGMKWTTPHTPVLASLASFK